MTNNTDITYGPRGFRQYGGDRLFAMTLLIGLTLTGIAVAMVSRHLNETVDVTQLVIVDVKRARVEMAREIAANPRREPPRPVKTARAPERTAPPPTVRNRQPAPPVLRVKPPPVLAIKPPPAIRVRPTPSTTPAPQRVAARPSAPPAAAPVARPTAVPPVSPSPNAGSRLATGATSTVGTAVVGGEGSTQAGTSGAGIGGESGRGTGAGRGVGAQVPSPHPTGDAPVPPPVAAPTPAAPVAIAPPTPKPVVVAKPPPLPPPPTPNRVADRAEATITSAPAPSIPSAVIDDGVSGSVTVQFMVRANGRITDVEIKRSDDRALNAAALAAARRIKARPAVQDGVPRDTLATYTYRFVAQ
jgi:TonB family protein